jgi:hypothetical protein
MEEIITSIEKLPIEGEDKIHLINQIRVELQRENIRGITEGIKKATELSLNVNKLLFGE